MKYLGAILFLLCTSLQAQKWPMFNDPNFDDSIDEAAYDVNSGPLVLFDGAHHNFFIQSHLIKPLADVLLADGYRVAFNDKPFSARVFKSADVLVIITALPFDFTTQASAAESTTFTDEEIEALKMWVNKGGALLVFSEHAPFDQAIQPLLNTFDITTSVGVTIDTLHYDTTFGNQGMIVFSGKSLEKKHPIISGKREVNQLVSFGGSALKRKGFTNLLKLSQHAINVQHPTGVGPQGKGNSQALAGNFGKGKVVALGDSNGFTAMLFNLDEEHDMAAGMNTKGYDWKNFVLNTFDWLANDWIKSLKNSSINL